MTMTESQVTAYLEALTDEELILQARRSSQQLEQLAHDEPDSEEHAGCFAAVLRLSVHMARRGLTLTPTTLH